LPNIKSAIKRVKITKSKTLQNTIKKSELKTAIKKAKEDIAKKDADASQTLKDAILLIDKAAAKKIMHKNTAARKKSRLTKALNASIK